MDLRFALRSLRRNPGFAVGAVAVLALGIGANTAIFSVVNAVLLKPLHYPNPERIMALETSWKNTGNTGRTVSAADFHDWRKQATLFEAMAYHIGGQVSTVVNGSAEYADAHLVTPDFFAVFSLPPTAGRVLTATDGRVPAAVVSHGWAERHFGGDAAALGKTVKANGTLATVVGVMPPGFGFPNKTDLWLPAGLFPETPSRTAHNYTAVGRLRPGVTVEAAREQMRAIGDRLEQQYPENRFKSVAVTPLQERLTKGVRTTLWVLLGAVALVLLIACANVANLLLVRATARTREVAVRAAMGASRGRIIRQLLTESLVLAVCGALVGVGLAVLALDGLTSLAPANVPRLETVRLDGPVLLFSLALAFASSVLFGLAPALQASRLDLNTALKLGGSRGTLGGTAGRTRSVLVVAEVALSVVLLAGAGLLLRSFQALSAVDLGFATDRLLVTELSAASNDEEQARRVTGFYRDLLDKLRALPGVVNAAGVRTAPLGDSPSNAAYWIQGRPEGRPGEYPNADMQVVTPGYFATLGIPLKLGRDFADTDEWNRPQVAIVNEAFVKRAFAGGNPLGHKVRTGYSRQSMQWTEIVGVVRDIRQTDPSRPARPELYLPYQQHPSIGSRLSLVTRTPLEPAALTSIIRATVRVMDPEVPVRFQTMEAMFAQSLSYPRFRTLLIGSFACLAALLAAVGIYSVLSYLVTQRTAEIGVRRALGAQPRDVVRLVVQGSLRLTVLGLVLGLMGAFFASRLLRSLLYAVSPADPATYLGVVIVLGLAALVASAVPALRAARVDPLVALRQE